MKVQKIGFKQINHYVMIKMIGKGATATVYQGADEKLDNLVAIKCISSDKLDDPRTLESFKRELKILHVFKHPNIIQIKGIEKTAHNVYLALEYCNGKNLLEFQRYYKSKNKNLSELVVQKILRQLTKGLKYMHEHHTIHRDIKLENILLNFPEIPNKIIGDQVPKDVKYSELKSINDFEVKIADLGYARELDASASTICGTPITMAPDVFNQGEGEKKYNTKADLWSLGAITYELLVGNPPFYANRCDELFNKVKNGKYRLPKALKLSVEAISFINGLLQFYPDKRMDWNQIDNHPFLKNEVETFHFIDLKTVDNYGDARSLEMDIKNCDNYLWLNFQNQTFDMKLDQVNDTNMNKPENKKLIKENAAKDEELMKEIEEERKRIKEKQRSLEKMAKQVDERVKKAGEKEKEVDERERKAGEKEKEVGEKEKEVGKKEKEIGKKEKEIGKKEKEIGKKEKEVGQKEKEVSQKEKDLLKKDAELEKKKEEVNALLKEVVNQKAKNEEEKEKLRKEDDERKKNLDLAEQEVKKKEKEQRKILEDHQVQLRLKEIEAESLKAETQKLREELIKQKEELQKQRQLAEVERSEYEKKQKEREEEKEREQALKEQKFKEEEKKLKRELNSLKQEKEKLRQEIEAKSLVEQELEKKEKEKLDLIDRIEKIKNEKDRKILELEKEKNEQELQLLQEKKKREDEILAKKQEEIQKNIDNKQKEIEKLGNDDWEDLSALYFGAGRSSSIKPVKTNDDEEEEEEEEEEKEKEKDENNFEMESKIENLGLGEFEVITKALPSISKMEGN